MCIAGNTMYCEIHFKFNLQIKLIEKEPKNMKRLISISLICLFSCSTVHASTQPDNELIDIKIATLEVVKPGNGIGF